MTLSAIRQYLAENGGATLPELSRHFDADPSLVESMLEHWIRKGRVALVPPKPCGPSCCGGCSSHGAARYLWSGGEA
ncbi:FeoC-like transcriptional regulator [Chlorobium sp. N1]|uniref:FeoC-like transcriptional regulator n=1 Tax=Chlorobium sp. N1 TaxID=2491138 RepID=UPI00103B3C9E|nr:FeoC-like transcriptional regulator [Chlorobium sp. N1]TCD47374.1 hypothetical protein E0L29_08830 [Chlorobium sp. N1]